MSHIHFPPECTQDPVIGPLMQPTNEAQLEAYEKAVLAHQKYAATGRSLLDAVTMQVSHNLLVAGRNFMPFSVIAGPEVVFEPYSRWQGYECLVILNVNEASPNCMFFPTAEGQLSEKDLIDRLLAFRRYLVQAVHPLDKVALDAAIAEGVRQIDKQRMRKGKRCETGR